MDDFTELDTRLYPGNTRGYMDKYIYFVGKPYPIGGAIETCRELGFKVGLFLDKNFPTKSRANFDEIIEVDFTTPNTIIQSISDANPQHVSGLVCTFENYIIAKSVIAEQLHLPAPSINSARMSTDKNLMRQAFMKADKNITPNFGLISSEDELLRLASQLQYPLMLKPTNLVKSLLILKCANEQELISNYRYAKERIGELYEKYKIYDREPQLIIEEYITGNTCSVAAFVDNMGVPHFCDGIVSLENASDIGVDDNYIYARHLPADFNDELSAQIFDVATKGIKALDMRSTPAHVELIYNDGGVKLIEIGARIGGYRPRMYDIAYGVELIEQEIKLALGELPELSGTFKAYTAVYELFPSSEGTFDKILGATDTSRYAYYAVKAQEGATIGPAKNGYKAAVIIIVSHEDKQTFQEICETVRSIQVRIR